MLLEAKRAVITGGSMGLGLEIGRAYVKEGASVVLSARSEAALLAACDELRALCSRAGQSVDYVVCDIADEQDVQQLFNSAIEILGGLDILVNNAGVYGPKGALETVDNADWRRTIEINLFGTLYASQAAVRHFKQQKSGKVINLSGGGATAPLPNISAYAASKAAVVRLTETLAEELRGTNIDVNAIAPGALNTRLMDEVLVAGPDKVGESFYQATMRQAKSGGTPLGKGAKLCVYLASEDSNGITGKLISAVWDSWGEFNQHREDIETSDLYTLRRIVTTDRGLDWETL